MAKRRMLHDRFWTSQNNLKWTIRQRLLFLGIISTVDDQGRMNAHPALVRSAIFPYDDITLDEIQTDLQAIADTGAVVLYDCAGLSLVQVTNWWQYQQPQWAQPSTLPAPDGWTDRIRYRRSGTILSYNWTAPSGKERPDNCDEEGAPIGEPLAKALPKALPDTPSYGLSSAPSDSDSDSDSVSDSMGIARRKRREPKPVPPAVAAFRESVHRYPPKSWYQRIASAVGESEDQLAAWRDVCVTWVGRGYNPQNVVGMLDAFQAGGLAPQRPGGDNEPPDPVPRVRVMPRPEDADMWER